MQMLVWRYCKDCGGRTGQSFQYWFISVNIKKKYITGKSLEMITPYSVFNPGVAVHFYMYLLVV